MEFMESNSEEKVVENEGVDIISSLPDLILNQILSDLPTKNAVAASILSTRWKNLSPFAVEHIRLRFDDTMLLHPKENESDSPSVTFTEFVDKLFNETLSDVHCVEGMTLSCEKDYGDAKILSWVRAALQLNIEWLTLSLRHSELYSLFAGLNGCTTLVRLVLVLDSEFRLPDGFCLPNLKRLHLFGLTVKSGDSIIFSRFLTEGCPALEDLLLTDCTFSILGVMCPWLKNFKMEDCSADSIGYFVLNAPNLEVLELKDYVAWEYVVPKFKSPRAALINVGPSQQQLDVHSEYYYDNDGSWRFINGVANLVIACSNTSYLQLAGCSISALCGSSIKLPEFQKLTHLSLGRIGLDGWALLACFLQNAPNLEMLNFEEGFTENKGEFANFQKSMPVSPVCLQLHMRRIQFWVFEGDEDEMKLVEYFLKTGCVLEELAVFCLPPNDILMFPRLLMMPRESETCQIECGMKI